MTSLLLTLKRFGVSIVDFQEVNSAWEYESLVQWDIL